MVRAQGRQGNRIGKPMRKVRTPNEHGTWDKPGGRKPMESVTENNRQCFAHW